MKASSKAFSEKFCQEMIQATGLNRNRLFAAIKSDLQLYDDDDRDGKLKYINRGVRKMSKNFQMAFVIGKPGWDRLHNI